MCVCVCVFCNSYLHSELSMSNQMVFNSNFAVECPDFTTVDEEALKNFLSLEHFNDTRRALEYGGIRCVV